MKALLLLLYLGATAAPVVWLAMRGGRDGDVFRRVAALASDSGWRADLLTASLTALAAATLAVLIALPTAIGLTAWRPARRRRLAGMLWYARVVPPVLLAVPLVGFLGSVPQLSGPPAGVLVQLIGLVPVATAIVFVAAAALEPALVWEAHQDGLGRFATFFRVWWPSCRSACALAFLWCFAASFADASLGVVLLTSRHTPAEGVLQERAVAALALLPVAVAWAALLGWWWTRARPGRGLDG